MTPQEARLKKIRMRCWRRGIKEMDLVLGRFADTALCDLAEDELTLFEVLLEESDHDLYQWVSAQSPVPAQYGPLIAQMAQCMHEAART